MAGCAVTVVATIRAAGGKADALREVLAGLVAPTRAETGCVEYRLHESAEMPGTFLFFETWATRELLAAHGKSPHVRAFRDRLDELTEGGVDISLWSVVES